MSKIDVKTAADRIEDMRLAASSIREWMPETLPANEDGQVHFARALAESAAEAIERFIAGRSCLIDKPEAGEDLLSYYERQIEWSRQTFGPALRTKGVIDHIRKELCEIEQEPHDLSEWVDVVILAMDGFWRHGGNAADLFPALLAKQKKNMARSWPDWRTMSEDSAIEHDRSKDAAISSSPLSAGDAGEEARQIIRGFLDCPEVADCEPEDLDNETRHLERRARKFLASTPTEAVERLSAKELARVVTSSPHTITAGEIILRFDPKTKGHNALNQLWRRLEAALAAAQERSE